MREDETPIETPSWVPPSVKAEIESLRRQDTNNEHSVLLKRLEAHPKMQDVWRELSKRDRISRAYFYPAKMPSGTALSIDQIQNLALAETIRVVYHAILDDRRSVRADEIEPQKSRLLADVMALRRIADGLCPLIKHFSPSEDLSLAQSHVQGMLHAANWLEALANHFVSPDDPNVMRNERVPPLVRGIQVILAAFFMETFGKRLDGLAAAITNIALETDQATERVSRSAFSKRY